MPQVIAIAKPSLSISYSITDSRDVGDALSSITESSSVGYTSLQFEYGTGIGQVNMGITHTGTLPSGGSTQFDFDAFPKSLFGGSYNVSFASRALAGTPINPEQGVKGILITNTWSHPSGSLPSGFSIAEIPSFVIAASGEVGFSGLFNEGSGSVKVMPSSTWGFTDYVGVTPHMGPLGGALNNKISLIDSGSGISYEIAVVGVTGTGSVNPC